MRSIWSIFLLSCCLSSFAQVSESSSGLQQFSVKGQHNSARIHFDIQTIHVSDSADRDHAGPLIEISQPLFRGVKLVALDQTLNISGKVSDPNGVVMLTVNGSELEWNEQGEFSTVVKLAYGTNTFVFKALDQLQNASEKRMLVERENEDEVYVQSNTAGYTWLNPVENGHISHQEFFNLKVCIELRHKVRQVEYFLDGFKVGSLLPNEITIDQSCGKLASKAVKLHLGTNRLMVQVETDEEVYSSVREVVFKPRIGRQMALIIGVEKYTDNAITDLNEPIRDASSLKKSVDRQVWI